MKEEKRLTVKKNVFGLFYILIAWLIDWLTGSHHEVDFERKKSKFIFFKVFTLDTTIIGELTKMKVERGQFFDITVKPVTADGEDADYQHGTGQFTSGDENIITVSPHPEDPENELRARCIVDESANLGSTVIEFKADADPDDDETREVIGTLAVTVAPPEASVFELQATEPQDLPEHEEEPEGEGDPLEG